MGDHSLYVEKKHNYFFITNYQIYNLSLNVVYICFKIGDTFKHKNINLNFFIAMLSIRYIAYVIVYTGETSHNLQACFNDHNLATNSNQ